MLRRSTLFALLFVVPTIVSADPAVESTNGSLGSFITKGRSSDVWGDSNTYMLNGSITMPLGGLFGFKLSAGYAASDSDFCDTDWRALGTQLFMRDPSIGRIGVSYGQARADVCDVSGNVVDDDAKQDSYGISAEYYFEPLTIGVSRSRNDYDVSDVDYTHIDAVWYPGVNFSVGLSAGTIDDEDERSMTFAYQPAYFDNTASVSLTLRTLPDSDVDSATVGFTYYFGDNVDLKTRDRKYR